jgi:molecular chaperone GrpE (heat shock protein)
VGNLVVFVALILMAAATLAAISVSFYLYRWRQILMANGELAVVPEELVAQWRAVLNELNGLRADFSVGSNAAQSREGVLLQRIAETKKSVETLFESTTNLQAALDDRDAEIQRLRSGYEAEVFRKFVARFIRVKEVLNEAQEPNQLPDLIHQALRLFDDALDECGVERFSPPLGEDYRAAVGVADNPKIVATADADQNFRIAEILEPGYRFRATDAKQVIRPARVCIFLSRSQET